jgi:hypothetical protein
MQQDAKAALAGHTQFDPAIFDEATLLLNRLSLDRFCVHATKNGNHPDPFAKIVVAGSIRSLGHSPWLFGAEPEGVFGAMLYYFVTLCEGVLFPNLQPFVDLAEQSGLKGPQSKKTGKFYELDNAREDFGPALHFLSTAAAGVFAPDAQKIANAIQEFNSERIHKLRNSIAHFKFLFEFKFVDADVLWKQNPNLPQDKALQALALNRFQEMKRILGLTNAQAVPGRDSSKFANPDESKVFYEEDLEKSISSNSRQLTFVEVMALVDKVERFAMSISFAFLQMAAKRESDQTIKRTACPCGEGAVLTLPTATAATCSACGKSLAI